MSIERSRNDSSRDDTFVNNKPSASATGRDAKKCSSDPKRERRQVQARKQRRLTVSQVRHRVSDVRVPSKRRCTRVPLCCGQSEFAVTVAALFDTNVTEDDTDMKCK